VMADIWMRIRKKLRKVEKQRSDERG
jgi:hypothetical protein